MSSIRSVLVVEDDPATRQHFVAAIEGNPRLRLHGAAATCAEARLYLSRGSPDVLLTDLGLPDGNGIDLIREVRRTQPSIQVLVSSVFGDERTVMATVEAGANGYLLKDGTSEQIGESLLDLIDGGSPISAPIARYILRVAQERLRSIDSANAAAERHQESAPQKLSRREIEVLELLAKGFSAAEIAELLNLSQHTIVAHCRNIHRKLDVTSRSSAIFEAAQLGLIRIHD